MLCRKVFKSTLCPIIDAKNLRVWTPPLATYKCSPAQAQQLLRALREVYINPSPGDSWRDSRNQLQIAATLVLIDGHHRLKKIPPVSVDDKL
jgi:hypothetical protein